MIMRVILMPKSQLANLTLHKRKKDVFFGQVSDVIVQCDGFLKFGEYRNGCSVAIVENGKCIYKRIYLLEKLKNKNAILIGDFNIAHTELDVFNAKQNQNNTMFTPKEREQISKLLKLGYTDTFRYKYPDKKSYTWWPYWRNLRARDIGWRIDYCFITKPLRSLIKDALTQREVLGSDHCPFGIILNK